MKRKPRIFKLDRAQWAIHLPGYGFARDKVICGFESFDHAHRHFRKYRVFSGSAQVERASRPGSRNWHELYPMPIVGDHDGL